MRSCNEKVRKVLATLIWVISTARNAIIVVICTFLGQPNLVAFSNPWINTMILFKKCYQHYILDVLWVQPIKLIQVVSTLEFHE